MKNPAFRARLDALLLQDPNSEVSKKTIPEDPHNRHEIPSSARMRCAVRLKTSTRHDHTHFGQAISNEAAADWMAANVPLFDCPDKDIKEIYHFRWWTFRKHIKETADGFVITEFLPRVSWSGKHNTIYYDKTGKHYHKGKGLRILADGKEIAARETLGILTTKLTTPR